MVELARADIPEHVKEHQIFEYNYYSDSRIDAIGDVQLGMHTLHADAPDVFYSPMNGGFWVITRLDIMTKVLTDPEHFSNEIMEIPRIYSSNRMIPLNLDPPDHLPFRMAVARHFDPKTIRALEPNLRMWANRFIDAVVDRRECEFVGDVSAPFPVSVFMELMGLPLDRFEEFLGLAHDFFRSDISAEGRIRVQETIINIVSELFAERRVNPKDDLMSKLVTEKVRGRPISDDELNSIGYLLFLAGLDTVTNTLSFTFNNLARRPDLQARLTADTAVIPSFVEESLRRFSIVQQPRFCKKDVELFGAHFKAGDMVVCSLILAGMDERKNDNPEIFDIDRQGRAHLAFSTGPHICIGNFLARAEMRILTEEWLKRIPNFRIRPGSVSEWRTGGVAALTEVHLEW